MVSIQMRHNDLLDERSINVPFDVFDVRNCDELQSSALIQCFQSDRILLIDPAISHVDNSQVRVIESKVSRLPRSDYAVVWPADHHELLELKHIVTELTRVVRQHFVVHIRQEVAVAEVKLSLIWIVPIVSYGGFLTES